MFSIIVSHSLIISANNDDGISYMVGSFGFVWIKANCYVALGFIGGLLVLFCCCCGMNESNMGDASSMGSCFDSDRRDYGFERLFLPQSRMDLVLISDFEHVLATFMLVLLIFVIAFIVCGFVPFFEFLNGGLSGYTHFPYIASLWFLSIIVMTFQLCWTVRARCCGDEEDKQKAQVHEQQVQRAATMPNIMR